MSKIKIEIKNRWTGEILFEYEKENNTIKDTLVEAVSRGADLSGAYLRGAYLSGADLSGADLRGAYLSGAKDIPYIPLSCPSDGAFVGWKKVYNGAPYLVKLLILEDARRSSATSLKCRCDKAQVLAITNLDGSDCGRTQVVNPEGYERAETRYKVGEIVLPDSFDEDRWNECSHGIHFFINKQDAINY